MTEKVKKILLEKFDRGTKPGYKANPGRVSNEMVTLRTLDSKLMFQPEERRTLQQIWSYFSRLSSNQKKSGPLLTAEDTKALESECARLNMR